MAKFKVHTPETAPDGSREFITGVNKKMGFVPSLYAVMAENPATLNGYLAVAEAVGKSGLTGLEQQIVLITASVVNECHFCVAAHSAMSEAEGLDMAIVSAIREDRPIDDPRLEALRVFTKKTVMDRGFVSDCDVDTFIKAGWTQSSVLAVILGIALKTISNYTNHVAETPLNDAFQNHAWSPAKSH